MDITDKDGNTIDFSALGISSQRRRKTKKKKGTKHHARLHPSLLKRLSISEPTPIYSFGSWGLTTSKRNRSILPGFSPLPPGPEICGTYKIVYIAAVQDCSQIILRRQPDGASVIIDESAAEFAIGSNGRLGSRGTTIVQDTIMIDGQVHLPDESGLPIKNYNYFGPGYKFVGFSSDSHAATSYKNKPANAGLIVTKKNDNKGRIFVVDEPKAFKLVHSETGVVANEVSDMSQEHETLHARQSCESRHYSFLCRELGLPCSSALLVTSFLTNLHPYIFAEPGDLWLDIRLTTPVNTYVLARRSDKVVFPYEKLFGRINAMISDYMAQPDKTKFLQSVDEIMATPSAMQTTLEELSYLSVVSTTNISDIVDMVVTLHENKRVSAKEVYRVSKHSPLWSILHEFGILWQSDESLDSDSDSSWSDYGYDY